MDRNHYTTHLHFASLHRSKATQNAVRKSVRDFLRFVVSDPHATDENLVLVQESYLNKIPDEIFQDLVRYVPYLVHEMKNAPNTIRLKLHYTKAWLEYNFIFLSQVNEKILKNLQPRVITVTEEAELSREILCNIVENADFLTQTIITILASSGMRIGELLGIFPEDITFGDPGEIYIPCERMKAGKPHTYYFSQEAQTLLKEYLRTHNAAHQRIFQISYSTIANRLIIAEKRAGVYAWSTSGKRSKITYHSIRKWTESTMKLHIPINIANELIGHDEGLSVHYRRYGSEKKREAYRVVEPYLSLFEGQDIVLDQSLEDSMQVLLNKQEDILQRLASIEKMLLDKK